MLLAIALSNQLAQPLLLLAEGVRAGGARRLQLEGGVRVARRARRPDALVRRDDRAARPTRASWCSKSVVQVEGARANLQTILDNLTAGVIVFDRERRDRHRQPGRDAHPAAAAVGLPRAPARRGRRPRRLRARRSGSASSCTPPAPRPASATTGRTRSSCRPAARPAASATSITLLVRGAAMPQGARLMVFDDITELVSAQRVEAWSEVARRLAHEIKNPLTPIQLSAERLQHQARRQARGRRPGDARSARSTTIVNQVQAMKTLVNEFRDYARLPAVAARRRSTSTPWSARCSACTARRRRRGAWSPSSADGAAARSSATRTQLRQVIHNLVQNALDAVAEQARRPGARRHRGGAQRAGRSARGAPDRASTMGPGSRRRCSSAPSSPTSRPRPKAPASAWRW